MKEPLEEDWIEAPERKKSDWDQDPKTYLLIRINKDKKRMEVRVMDYDKNVVGDYYGYNPEDLYYKIINDECVTKLQHAAYLGSELQKAYMAIKLDKEYVQDEDLDVQ